MFRQNLCEIFYMELIASKTFSPAVILNEVKDLLRRNKEILRCAQNDILEITRYEFMGLRGNNFFMQGINRVMGFTLIETIVAVALLLAVVLGPIALIGDALSSAAFSRNTLIANYLAQEGIEFVREIRDNNVICATLDGDVTQWNEAPGLGGVMKGYYEISVPVVTLTCGGSSILTPQIIERASLAACNTPFLVTAAGVYNYTLGTATSFSRCVYICTPPAVAPCGAPEDAGIPAVDQMFIYSRVSWTEHGVSKSLSLRNRLYAWK